MHVCRHSTTSSTSKLSSSMGQQSSKSLFSSPASLISGKSLSEKLDRLEKQLKKKEQLRNKIDPSMYNFQHKSPRHNPKHSRQSQFVARNSSMMSRSSVIGRRNSAMSRNSNGGPGAGPSSSSRSDLSDLPEEGVAPAPPSSSSSSPLYAPKAPPGKRQASTSSPPPGRKHRHLSEPKGKGKTKAGVQASDSKEDNSNTGAPTSISRSESMSSPETSPKVEAATRKRIINHTDSNSSIPPPNETSPAAEKRGDKENKKEKNISDTTSSQRPKFESLQSTVGQHNFADKVKKDNKNERVEVLATVQYFSSPDKLCKTTPSELLVLNGTLLDDPTKKYFHPVQKDNNKVVVKKNSNYVADIMRIGLTNKEINEREKLLIAQKQKLGISKEGYIEGIRSKNNKNLFRIQRGTILRRQNLNRRTNEFNFAKKDFTRKGIEAARRKELGRPSHRVRRLDDLSVEDSIWQSKVCSRAEQEQQNSFFGGQSYNGGNNENDGHFNSRLDDVSQVSDFNHNIQGSTCGVGNNNSNNNEQPPPSETNNAISRPSVMKRRDSASEKADFQILLAQQVLDTANKEIQSTVLKAHTKMCPSSHGDVSPRAGESAFLENQSRMEEVIESKQIQYLEEHKWIMLVVDLVKGLAAKRKAMASEERAKAPTTPNEVFVFIACLLRIALAGATVDKDTFYLLVQKVFSNVDHSNVISSQVITLVRTCLKITPQEHCDFLLSIGLQVTIDLT